MVRPSPREVADGTVKVWDVGAGRERTALTGHTTQVRSVALSADGKTVVSGSYDGTIKVWDVGTGRERATSRDIQAWSLPWD